MICCGDEIIKTLFELIHDVWNECRVPPGWCDAVLVPIPNKSNLKKYDNWTGIALLVVLLVKSRTITEISRN